MPTFVMLIKMSPELAGNSAALEEIDLKLSNKYREACPDVKITTQLALLGPYDLLNLVEAPSQEMAFRMASLLLASGLAASVETWSALHFTYPKMLELMIGI
jgi:uncharacterized protein with GYD domain